MSLECSDGRNSHHSLTLGLGNGRERTPQWVRGPGCSCITVHTRQGLPAPRCRAKSVTLITSKKLDSEGMSRVWTLGGCLLTRSSLSSGHKGFPSINLSILASLAACPRPVSAPGRTRRPVAVVWETVMKLTPALRLHTSKQSKTLQHLYLSFWFCFTFRGVNILYLCVPGD